MRVVELVDHFLLMSDFETLLRCDFSRFSMWMRKFLFPQLDSQINFMRIHFPSFLEKLILYKKF